MATLSTRVGFEFEESELSPSLRRRLGDLESMKGLLDNAGSDLDFLHRRKNTIWGYALMIGITGAILLLIGLASSVFVVLGLVAIVIAASLYYSRTRNIEVLLRQKRKDLAVIALGFDYAIGKASQEVFQELSQVHEAKIHPTIRQIVIDFASIIQVAHGRGVILETIQCPNCNGTVSLPKEGDTFQCQYCGKTIHAIDIFDKLKLW
jgi:uncharacterized membrane protein/ribosomal protein S27AE